VPLPRQKTTREGHVFEYHRVDGGYCRLCGLQIVVTRTVTYRAKDGRELTTPPRCPVKREKPIWGTLPPPTRRKRKPCSRTLSRPKTKTT
jgi:hypothetical protein